MESALGMASGNSEGPRGPHGLAGVVLASGVAFAQVIAVIAVAGGNGLEAGLVRQAITAVTLIAATALILAAGVLTSVREKWS